MSYKSSTNEQLLDYYKQNGLKATIEVAKAMLKSASFKNNKTFHSHVHGEICESVLECIILEYMRMYPERTKTWFYSKGLIVKDVLNPNNGYFTEIDLTVFTPQKIYAFECKSYGGDKKITERCKIVKKKGGSFDVYDQHEKHARVLSGQLNPFRKRETIHIPGYQLALFNFSLGETVDMRTPQNKVLMPCVDDTNVINLFEMNKNKEVIWNMAYVRRAIKIIERNKDENTKKHLEYVKNLKHNRR